MDMITKVGTTLVVDRRKLTALGTNELAAKMAEIYSNKDETVMLIDDPRQFFSTKNLMQELDTNGANLHVILQYRGVALTEEQVAAINSFSAVKQFIEDALIAQIPPAPPWQFAAVPTDWSMDTHLRINSRTVRRIRGRGQDYSLGLTTVQRLWEWIAPYWAGGPAPQRRSHYLRAGGGYYADAYADRVEIGCQTIQRYELEQLALSQGWAFPETVAKEL